MCQTSQSPAVGFQRRCIPQSRKHRHLSKSHIWTSSCTFYQEHTTNKTHTHTQHLFVKPKHGSSSVKRKAPEIAPCDVQRPAILLNKDGTLPPGSGSTRL